ncbi:MAG: hypothetical protein ABJP45_07775 [Cyclobacteriaceae bacterium]
MSKQLSYQLFNLIKRLTKAEKRHFKLYASRNISEKETLTIKLFDVLDRQKDYNEKKINQSFPALKSNTLSNQKAHLYELLLGSLRLVHHNDPKIRIKELISYADVLHLKGLYRQSLGQLQKAKQLAETHQVDLLRLEIIELEKQIESRYVTRSHSDRAEELIKESRELRKKFYFQGSWSDMALSMYDYYLKFGHTKNQEEHSRIHSFFHENIPDEQESEIIHAYQCYVWFYYITQDFVQCYRYARKWCDLYEKDEILSGNEPEMYLRGLHNSLSALYYCDDGPRFRKELKKLEDFVEQRNDGFNENQLTQAFIYLETAKLNLFFIEGKFTDGAEYCKSFEKRMKDQKDKLDIHRVMVFHYKMASLKFGSADFHGAVQHLNFIINHPNLALKEDIQCFARILNLIVHYELGNDDLIDFQIKSTYRFLLKLKDYQKVQSAIFGFLKKSVYMDRKQLIPNFKSLREELIEILKDPYERRPTLYLDVISWLESKIENKPVEQVIRAKKK